MSLVKVFCGDIIIQYGQVMQRAAAWINGRKVWERPQFKTVGSLLSENPRLKFPFVEPPSNFQTHSSTLIAGDVLITGECFIGENCSIRADGLELGIDDKCNIGNNVTILGFQRPVKVSKADTLPRIMECLHDSEIGDNSVLVNCHIGAYSIIGENCVIGEDSVVGNSCRILPNSVVPAGARVPDGEVWGGNPLKYVREA